MKYILKNISRFIRNETLVFFIILICVFCSSLILNFSYGLYQNYRAKKTAYDLETTTVVPTIVEGASVTKGELKEYSLALSQKTLDAMVVIYGMAHIDELSPDPTDYTTMYMRFTIHEGQFQICEATRKGFEEHGQIVSGRYITNEEEATGANVALLPYDWHPEFYRSLMTDEESVRFYDEENEMVGTKVRFFDREYKVIGTYNGSGGNPIVPFLTVPDSVVLDQGFGIQFTRSVTRSQYNELKNIAETVMPGKLIFDDMQIPDPDNILLYNNIMLIAVLISGISAINFTMLYQYMVQKRSRELAIFRICGCTKTKAVWLYLGECLLLSVPTYLVGIGCYKLLLKYVFADIFEYIELAYSASVYATIFIIYLVIMLVITDIMIRKRIASSVISGTGKGRMI